MRVHLIDGTYELFRHYFAVPSYRDAAGFELAATRGVVMSVLNMLHDGATHLAVATDHIIPSFRNDLWPGYKSGEGVEPDLLAQFPVVEEALEALGIVVWPMVEYEADDALAAGADMAGRDERVTEVLICTPDKDLAQCVVGKRVVQFDRRQGVRYDEAGVVAKFGVLPTSIPDYLALVGDTADGFPGIKGWGAKSSAKVLAHYEHIEQIPARGEDWAVEVRGRAKLAETLAGRVELALLFRKIATVVRQAPVSGSVDALCWRGGGDGLAEMASRLSLPAIVRETSLLAANRA